MWTLGVGGMYKFMNTKYTIIALMGKAGSGKDTIMKALLK
jgi:guanylate kinase